MDISINIERELYIIRASGGFSCLGFDNVIRELRLIGARIKGFDWVHRALESVTRGSLEAYQLYQRVTGEIARSGIKTDTWFPEGTPPKVAKVLERARAQGRALRLWFGDPVTGRDSLSEFEVHGRVGRSMGPFRVPLLIDSSGDGHAGGPLSTERVLRIVELDTGREIYRHRRWHLPTIQLIEITNPAFREAGYTVEALVDGCVHARFWDLPHAAYWLAMMAGHSLDNPEA